MSLTGSDKNRVFRQRETSQVPGTRKQTIAVKERGQLDGAFQRMKKCYDQVDNPGATVYFSVSVIYDEGEEQR